MDYLFSEAGRLRLNEIVQPGVLCVFDFDGTLAAIVDQPENAFISIEIAHRLAKLSSLTQVAVLTGRSIEDVRKRLRFKPAFIIGNHGLEGLPGWERKAAAYEKCCREWQSTLINQFHRCGMRAGVWIEDKRYSLAIHYRQAEEDHAVVEKRVKACISTLVPSPYIIEGKCVFNLLPDHANNKGTALEYLMRTVKAPRALYIGDDITDEDVFKLTHPSVLSIRVESHSQSAAAFYLRQRLEMIELLDVIITTLSEKLSLQTVNSDPTL